MIEINIPHLDIGWFFIGFLLGFVCARWHIRRRRRRGLMLIPPTKGPVDRGGR